MNELDSPRRDRAHVPFDGLWSMAIDVPYSYLVRDGDLAWTCGQLALGPGAEVLHPGDLVAQSSVVCDFVEAILARAELEPASVRRLYLYYVPPSDGALAGMLETFRSRFGGGVDLVTIPVPHFYYDGVVLEVDVFWARATARADFTNGPGSAHRLSEHVVIGPNTDPPDVVDPGAALVVPEDSGHVIAGMDVVGGAVREELRGHGGVMCTVRRAGSLMWVRARSTDGDLGLVAQTEVLMRTVAEALDRAGFTFADVVKSTTHYAGDSSAEDLHDNMAVRNAYYESPGPASTGIPVYGFFDPASKIVVDITLIRD